MALNKLEQKIVDDAKAVYQNISDDAKAEMAKGVSWAERYFWRYTGVIAAASFLAGFIVRGHG